jgi:hypothetical protein
MVDETEMIESGLFEGIHYFLALPDGSKRDKVSTGGNACRGAGGVRREGGEERNEG